MENYTIFFFKLQKKLDTFFQTTINEEKKSTDNRITAYSTYSKTIFAN